MSDEERVEEDPAVPSDLLDLYVQLEEEGFSAEQMEDAFK